MELDYQWHAILSKKDSKKKSDVHSALSFIITYIQNHEIYCVYGPMTLTGVFIFGLVGTKPELERFDKTIGKIIQGYNCQLTYSVKAEYKEAPNANLQP